MHREGHDFSRAVMQRNSLAGFSRCGPLRQGGEFQQK